MSDAHAVARDQLRAFIERIERLEEEKKIIADDIKDVYGEAKGTGFDTKILRKVIAIRKQDRDERAEQEAILDSYLAALGMIAQPDFFDEEPVNAKLIATVATGMQTEIGRKALIAGIDMMIAAEEAEERRSDAGLNILTKHEDIRTAPVTAEEHPHHLKTTRGDESGTLKGSVEDHGQVAGCKPESQTDGNETVTVVGDESGTVDNLEMDRATEGSFETGSEAAEKGRKAIATVAAPADLNHAGAGESPAADQPLTGGHHDVTSIAERDREIPTSNTGEGAANTALPDTPCVATEYVPPCGMHRPSYAGCFPDLTKAEYERLEKDIAVNRVREPIVRAGDIILDGWNRYTIARKYGFAYPIQEYSGSDVLLDVIEWQRASRNFTPAQEKKIAADLAKEFPQRADEIMAAFGLAEVLEAAQ